MIGTVDSILGTFPDVENTERLVYGQLGFWAYYSEPMLVLTSFLNQ